MVWLPVILLSSLGSTFPTLRPSSRSARLFFFAPRRPPGWSPSRISGVVPLVHSQEGAVGAD